MLIDKIMKKIGMKKTNKNLTKNEIETLLKISRKYKNYSKISWLFENKHTVADK